MLRSLLLASCFASALLTGLCVCLAAQVGAGDKKPIAVGENILNNPELRTSADQLPLNWNPHFEAENGCLRVLDENGVRFVRLSPGKGECECLLKQSDMRLVPGARYRVGAWVRTKCLDAKPFGIVVANWGWQKSAGPIVPKDTDGKWIKVEQEFEAPVSSFNAYSFYAYTINQHGGELDVRDPYVVALDEAGVQGILRAPRISDYHPITPVGPLLEDLPAGDSLFLLAYFTDRDGLKCRVYTQFGTEPERLQGEFPVEKNRVLAQLTNLQAGAKGRMRAEIVDRGGVCAKASYPIAVRADVCLSKPVERRLNNMVQRLLTASATDGSFVFSAPQDGWVRIVLDKFGKDTKVWLDGGEEPVAFAREGEPLETMRHVGRGDHRLRVAGSVGGELIVNAVPQLYCWAYPGASKWAPAYQSYRNSFITNYLYQCFNTIVWPFGPGVSDAEWKDFHRRGKQRIGHAAIWNKNEPGFNDDYETAEHLAGRFRPSLAADNPQRIVGLVYDEIFMASFKAKWIYADAMRLLQDADNPCCTWSSGFHFPYTALDAEYLSACANASHGKGRFFFETYPRFETTDPVQAEGHLSDLIDETARRAGRLVPGFAQNALYVMAMYTRIGSFCYDTTCEGDPKWMQDRYLQKLVTEHALIGLAGFGMYCYGDAEEEDTRWVCDAVRHYLLDGNTDSFAVRHGISLDPGLVRNGTFRQGLSWWEVDGSVRADSVKDLAKRVHMRRFSVGRGDEAAVFTRRAERPNTLVQRMDNLQPGRLYSLRYAVSPLKEVVPGGKAGSVRRYAFSARVEGADDVTAAMPIAEYGGADRILPRLNTRTIVFKARSATATIVFSDWQDEKTPGGKPDEELALSVVRARPYYVGSRGIGDFR